MDKRHWRCVLPAFCMVGLSISSASASSCLCRASRWTQLRLCSREFGRRLKRKTCWLPTYSVVHFQSCMWLRWALMSSNKSSNVLLLQHKFTLVVFLCWCSHLSWGVWVAVWPEVSVGKHQLESRGEQRGERLQFIYIFFLAILFKNK